jgi:hypothetical protein
MSTVETGKHSLQFYELTLDMTEQTSLNHLTITTCTYIIRQCVNMNAIGTADSFTI